MILVYFQKFEDPESDPKEDSDEEYERRENLIKSKYSGVHLIGKNKIFRFLQDESNDHIKKMIKLSTSWRFTLNWIVTQMLGYLSCGHLCVNVHVKKKIQVFLILILFLTFLD